MSDFLRQFLEVQLAVAKMLADQTETLIKEGSQVVQQTVSTASDMHDSGIKFLREVIELKAPGNSTELTKKIKPPQSTSLKSTKAQKSTVSDSFEEDRQSFSD